VARKLPRPQALPIREELEALVHEYLHVHNEVEQTKPGSSVRRRLEDRVLDTRARFDRLLEEWVENDELRERWREHLHTHAPAPDGPAGIEPLVFRGENDAGAVAEVRRRGDDLEVFVDGSLLERVAADEDFASRVPGFVFSADGFEFRETFAAPPEALDALEEFLGADDEQPPWDHASELFGDGLVDVNFDLTPRGRRALAV